MPRPPLPVGTWGTIRIGPAPGGHRARARFRDYDGRTRDVERTGKTKGAARSALTAALADRTAPGTSEITADTTMAQLSEIWLAEIAAAGRAENTRRRYRETLENYVRPALGALRIREANVSRLDRFLKTTTSTAGGPTAKLARSVISGMLGLAVRHGAADTNPVRDVATITIAKPEPRALTSDEVRTLRAAVRSYQSTPRRGRYMATDLVPIVDLLFATGARIGELLATRWSEVDLDAGRVTLSGTITTTDTTPAKIIRQDHTKTSGSRRTLTLPKFAVDSLMTHRVNAAAANTLDLVFPSAAGTPRAANSFRKQLNKALRDTNLDWVTPHTFRRTVATLIARSSDLSDAAAQLGHAGTDITARHYVQHESSAPDLTAILDTLGGPTSEGRDLIEKIVSEG